MAKEFNANYYSGLVKRYVNANYSWLKNVIYTKDDIVAFCIRFGAAEDHEKQLINKVVEKVLTEYFVMGNIRSAG